MHKDTPACENIFPVNWSTFPPLKCPSCGAEYISERNWDKPTRCKCGQLLWRAVKDELLEKLKSQEKVDEYRVRLVEIGLLRTGAYLTGNLTPGGMTTLRDPYAFSSASDLEAARAVLFRIQKATEAD